jgi:hypothetical protein
LQTCERHRQNQHDEAHQDERGRSAEAKCAKPRVNHAWTAGFVAINGHWAKMTAKLISINDSIGELWVLF